MNSKTPSRDIAARPARQAPPLADVSKEPTRFVLTLRATVSKLTLRPRAGGLAEPARGGAAERLRRGATLSLVIALVGAYALAPGLRAEVNEATMLLAQGDVASLRDYLRSFGIWAPLVSTLLMVLQSLVAPLPAFLLAFANGLAFGTFWGGLLTFLSALLAASISFGISRALGRATVERLAGRAGLAMANRWLARHGPWALLLARLMPVISFDIISYAAGLTAMRFRWFVLATAAGILPTTFLYAYLGEHISQSVVVLLAATLLLVAIAAVVATLWRRRAHRQRE